jgi:hypothetical protein
MKKIFGLLLITGTTALLSACGGLPSCNQELDECNRGGPYTEERTARAHHRVVVKQEPVIIPAPEAEPMPVPEPEPMPEPTPEPVIDDTPVMRSAEPQFTQISK